MTIHFIILLRENGFSNAQDTLNDASLYCPMEEHLGNPYKARHTHTRFAPIRVENFSALTSQAEREALLTSDSSIKSHDNCAEREEFMA